MSIFGKKQPTQAQLQEATLGIIKSLTENALSLKEEAIASRDYDFCCSLFNACIELDKAVSNILFGLKETVIHGFPDEEESEVSDGSELSE